MMMRYAVVSDLLRAFREDDRGATAIEYAMIGVLISICFIGAATAIGQHNIPALETIAAALTPDPE